MYQTISKILLLSLALLLWSSCDEDSFSQIVEIEIPEHESRPVLKMQLMAGEDNPQTLLSLSKGILDDEEFELPEDARVTLFQDGAELAQLEYYDDLYKYEAFLDEGIPSTAGVNYRLEAEVPGFETVFADQVMPAVPNVPKVTWEREGAITPDGDRVDEIVITIVDDEPGVTNYYGIIGFVAETVVNPNTGDTIQAGRYNAFLDTNDPLLSYSAYYNLVFTDESFDGSDFQARCYTYNFLPENSIADYEVQVFQLTRDAYLYARSLDQYNNAIDNPFAEPVTVHSNIEGGYGVFFLSNSVEVIAEEQ